MTEDYKNMIVSLNERLGLKTKFFHNEDICGYCHEDTVYLNENMEDLFKINLHEVLHFYEDNEKFLEYKDIILDRIEYLLPALREEYALRYAGLYSEKEIASGIIDTEIVIDMLVDEYSNEYDVDLDRNLKLGNMVLGSIEKDLDSKRYLTLTTKASTRNMNLTRWEKIFVENYYKDLDVFKEKHQFPNRDKEYRVREDIKNALEKLYNMSREDFFIDPNSPEVERELEGELKALEARGQMINITGREDEIKKGMAEKYSDFLYEEYMHIVSVIKESNYDDAFKYLMLNETLTRSYKKDNNKTISKKRDLNKTIQGHMTLNETVLDVIYNNAENMESFANLYFAALEIYNKSIAEKNNISLDGVETYGKGRWIKFEGKSSNEEEYLQNAQNLAALVKDTPWCTKTLAASQLALGDFYVFVDNNDKPHIAVRMEGDRIGEVRGILDGENQVIEEEYSDVAISFLTNNKDIENGERWLAREEWNKRIKRYCEQIKNKDFNNINIEEFIEDLHGGKSHESLDRNLFGRELKELINDSPEIIGMICNYYGCEKEEFSYELTPDMPNHERVKVCFVLKGSRENEDVSFDNLKTVLNDVQVFAMGCKYSFPKLERINGKFEYESYFNDEYTVFPELKYIGSANISGNVKIKMPKLEIIDGEASFSQYVEELPELKEVNGDFYSKYIDGLPKLEVVRGRFYHQSGLTSLPELRLVEGDVDVRNSKIQEMPKLERIDSSYVNFSGSLIRDLSSLKVIGNKNNIGPDSNIFFYGCRRLKELPELEVLYGNSTFSKSGIESLPKLEVIEGDASFDDTRIKEIPRLREIWENAYFVDSAIESLPELERIDGPHALFNGSNLTNIPKLRLLDYEDPYLSIISDAEFKRKNRYDRDDRAFVIDGTPLSKELEISNKEGKKR